MITINQYSLTDWQEALETEDVPNCVACGKRIGKTIYTAEEDADMRKFCCKKHTREYYEANSHIIPRQKINW